MADEMKEILISLGYDFNKPKKRRTQEEIEIDKQNYCNDKLKYDNEIYREQYNLDCLWSEAYSLHYEMDAIRNWHPHLFIDFIDELKDKKNLEDFWNLIDALKNGAEETACYLEKCRLYEYLQNRSENVQKIIESIKTQDEASIVMDMLIATEGNMLSLPKGYKYTKKNQGKRNRKRTRRTTYTYEHMIRFNRHGLEKYLNEIGVGLQRAQKISKILQYL